jgi:hypothetical protein
MQASTQCKFLMTQQLLPGLINGLLNGGIAWAQHHKTAALGLWAHGMYATDLLATGFLLPSLTWLILRPLLRRQARAGKAPVLAGLPMPRLVGWMTSSTWGGSLVIGLMGMGLVAGGTLLALQLLGSPSFVGTDYALFKGAFGALLTFVLQPVMVFSALAYREAESTG